MNAKILNDDTACKPAKRAKVYKQASQRLRHTSTQKCVIRLSGRLSGRRSRRPERKDERCSDGDDGDGGGQSGKSLQRSPHDFEAAESRLYER